MNIQVFFILLIINSINPTKNICIQGGNCPEGQGFCKLDSCICLYNYWSFNNKSNQSSPIYCNYKKYNRFTILIFEIFLPSFGHLIAGKYYFFILKFILLYFPIIYFICGFWIYKKDDGMNNINTKGWQPSREDFENVTDNLDDELHEANKKKTNIDSLNKIIIFLSFISLIAFVFMHLIDIFCYILNLYYDGNGVPFA